MSREKRFSGGLKKQPLQADARPPSHRAGVAARSHRFYGIQFARRVLQGREEVGCFRLE